MKLYQKTTVILLFVLASGFANIHKYYVSVTDIDYKKTSLEIISRLFIDDVEKMFLDRYDQELSFDNKKDKSKIDFYLQKYFATKLQIQVDNKAQQLSFIGWELEDDQVHCYVEIEGISSIKKIKVTNKLLFDIFENQQNITHLNVNGTKKSFLLIDDNNYGVLNF